MERQNAKEYEYLREEIQELRTCITSYIGKTIGGSCAGVFGLAALHVASTDNYLALAFVSFSTAIIISLVLVMMLYKCISHNRCAAYARLLADESFSSVSASEPQDGQTFVGWEICMNRLRTADLASSSYEVICEKPYVKRMLREHSAWEAFKMMRRCFLFDHGKSPKVDSGKYWDGLKQLGLAFSGRIRTTSWGFPPPATAIFFVLTLFYTLVGCYGIMGYFGWDSLHLGGWQERRFILTPGLVLLGWGLLWMPLCGRLGALMVGSATIDAYCFRFLAIRVDFVSQRFKVQPTYPATVTLLKEWHAAQLPTPVSRSQESE